MRRQPSTSNLARISGVIRLSARTCVKALVAAALLWTGGAPALADEPPTPLALTVHPSGFAPEPSALEKKLARRLRESDHLFRSICRGCGPMAGFTETIAPFEPQAILDRRSGPSGPRPVVEGQPRPPQQPSD